MQQIKFFKGIESDLPRLETQINQWMAQSGIRVLQVFGNLAPQSIVADTKSMNSPSLSPHPASDVLVAVLYEKS